MTTKEINQEDMLILNEYVLSNRLKVHGVKIYLTEERIQK